jgi:inosose dehydratase
VLRFAYSTINWGDTCDLPQACAEIRQAGWNAAELFAHTLDWLGTPNHLKATLNGLIPATLFGSVDLPSSERQRTLHKRRIEYAAEIGAEAYGLVGGGRLRTRAPSAADIRDLAGLCEDLARHGATLGVTVAYHPHTGCTVENEAEIDALLNESQTLQLCLDASHIALVGEDPLSHLRRYQARTGYIHLKDWGKGAFAEMGRGSIGIDFPAILRELEAQQFAHWVVIEQSRSDETPLRSAQINADYLRSIGYDPGRTG